jgi:hypothetical protein
MTTRHHVPSFLGTASGRRRTWLTVAATTSIGVAASAADSARSGDRFGAAVALAVFIVVTFVGLLYWSPPQSVTARPSTRKPVSWRSRVRHGNRR